MWIATPIAMFLLTDYHIHGLIYIYICDQYIPLKQHPYAIGMIYA